jgi:hypothetical protein
MKIHFGDNLLRELRNGISLGDLLRFQVWTSLYYTHSLEIVIVDDEKNRNDQSAISPFVFDEPHDSFSRWGSTSV